MLKDDKEFKEFDEFLKDFSIADIDVQFIDNIDDDWMHCVGATDDEMDDVSGSSVTTKVIALPPPTTTICDQKPSNARGRGRARPGRFKARQQASAPRRRHRDRRRNEYQRKRENEKRKEKQSEFMHDRDDCFEAERALRGRVACILSDLAARCRVTIHQTLHMLPPDLLAIMRSSEAAMARFRGFTGQKHLCAKLNSFPMWPALGDPVKMECPEKMRCL